MAPRKKGNVDWLAYLRSNTALILAFVGLLVTFYFTTKATLDKHEDQFKVVAKQFTDYGDLQRNNFATWMATNKEEAAERKRMGEAFGQILNQLNVSAATTTTKVEAIGKQLESVTGKIDTIQSRQQEHRNLLQRR